MFNNIFYLIDKPNNLDKLKIHDLFLQDGGMTGTAINFNIGNFIIGIILLVIAFLLLLYKYSYKNTHARILNSNDNKINIEYIVNNVTYNKLLIIQDYNNINNEINIYYDTNDPNIIKLHNNDNYIFALLIIILGLYFILQKN